MTNETTKTVNIEGREWKENLQDRTLLVPDTDWLFQISPKGCLTIQKGKSSYEKQFQDLDTALQVAEFLISILETTYDNT